jgi:autotransporter-associated beta strand protein
VIAASGAAMWLASAVGAHGQERVLGVDVSYWNRGSSSPSANGITQAAWNTAYSTPNVNGDTRHFAWVRATRGGTTGLSTGSGTPNNPPATETESARYDDPEFLRTMTRATTAGLMAGPYHYGRSDVAGNTGANEADHFIEYASAYMRPGYLMPVYDLEGGSGSDHVAQHAIDFSNRLYERMKIRPAMYINGNYSSILQGATTARRNQLAQPVGSAPTVVGPAYPMLWNARYSDNSSAAANDAIPIQTGSPKFTYTTSSGYYGPWDDYGNTDPWSFWQYGSVSSVPGLNTVDGNVDTNVSHGDIEYVKNYLVPAVWWNDASGEWSTMTNWNSGQPLSTFNAADLNNPPAPYVPHIGSGQTTPFTGYTLPAPRLPGTAGSGPAITSGVHDTVILERPSANITVTLSSGSYNIRKLYMREALAITGGSLTINYNPTYRPDTSALVLHGGPISAQFSGPVTLSGSGSLNVNTLQVDATRTFTLAGSTGSLTFRQINLMPHSITPGKILLSGDVNVSPLGSNSATISNGAGSGSSGSVDLGGAIRAFNVSNGAADVDLDVSVPITNGGLTKNGAGTMRLSGNNTFAGNVTVNSGVLRYGHSSGLASAAVATVNSGGTLDMNNFSDTIAGLAGQAGGVVNMGTGGLTISSASGSNTYNGNITGSGTVTKNGGSTQVLAGTNTLGPVQLNAGTLLMNGASTTGSVTVAGGTLGGTGSISGAVTINNNAHLAPGASIESLDVGSLTLSAGSILDFELDTVAGVDQSDLVNVTSDGGLTINGGTLNLTNLGSMTSGTYTLLDYAGALAGGVANLSIGQAPTGYLYNLVDTGSLINLEVVFDLAGDLNHDLAVDAADYIWWRSNNGTTEEFMEWRENFGNTVPEGSGLGGDAGAAIPEPGSLVIALCALLPLAMRRARW